MTMGTITMHLGNPSRTVPMQFRAPVLPGGLAGAATSTSGGVAALAARCGRDLSTALIADAVAVFGALQFEVAA